MNRKTFLAVVATVAVLPLVLSYDDSKKVPIQSIAERFKYLEDATHRFLKEQKSAKRQNLPRFSPQEYCNFLKAEKEQYGNTVCECDEIDSGVRFTCSEPDCQYCNQDFTVCGTTTYGADLNDMSEVELVWFDVELMGEPPLRVRLEQSGCSGINKCKECVAFVGDNECNGCGFCNDYGSIELDCDNVQLDGDYAKLSFSANECQPVIYPLMDDSYRVNQYSSDVQTTVVTQVLRSGNYNEDEGPYMDQTHTPMPIDYVGDEFGQSQIGEAVSMIYPAPDRTPNFIETYVRGFCLPRDIELSANDICSDATEVTPGSSVIGSLYGASPDAAPSCNQGYYVPIIEEGGFGGVWYYVIGTGNLLHLSTCSEITNVDVSISVFDGNCDNLGCTMNVFSRSSYDCNSGNGYSSFSVAWQSQESARYYVYVGSQYGSYGNFELSALAVAPTTNDDCVDAIPVAQTDGSIIVGTIVGAMMAETCSYPSPSPGVWYTVDGMEGAIIRLSTCTHVTNFQVEVSIFSGNCGSLDCFNGYRLVAEQQYCEFGNTIEWLSDGDTKYYILVHSQYEPQPTASIFGLSVFRFVPPDNDVCTGAVAIGSDTIYVEGTTLTATSETIAQRCNNDYYDGAQEYGVWYQVDGTGSALRVSTCSEVTDYESRISVFSGSCASLQCETVGITDYSCLKYNSQSRSGHTATWISRANTTYYLLVHGNYWAQNNQGNFGLTISRFVPAENDVCSGASPLSLNDQIFSSTENALGEPEWENVGIACDSDNYYYSSAPSVWYTFVGTGSGLRASTCSFATTFETTILIFTGSCDNPTCMTGSPWDDHCLSFGTTVSWITEVDTIYYILVQGAYSEAVGNFSLFFEEFEPAENDMCSGAIDIEIDGDVTQGSLADATTDRFDNSYCGASIESSGVWYRVVGVDAALRASTCSNLTNFDTSLSVYTGECDMLQCIAGSSYDSSFCGVSSNSYGASSVSWSAEADVVYYILVHAKSYSYPDSFGLTVETFEPAVNDDCEGALPISPGSTTEGSTLNATADFSPNFTCGYFGLSSPGVWYKVEGTGLGMTASTCSNATDFSAALAVFEGECGNLRCIDANEYAYESTCISNSGYGNSEVSWGTRQGSTYYVLVTGGYQSSGNFGLSLSEFKNAPHDVCNDAVVASSDGQVYSASIKNATADFPSGSNCGNAYFDGPGIWFSVAGKGSALRATTCNGNVISRASIAVYSGTCGDFTCVVGANVDYQNCSTAAWMTSDSTNYYLYVHFSRYDYMVGASVGISVKEFEAAANDLCDGAEALVVDGSVVIGSTKDATQDSITEDYCNFPYGGYYGGGVQTYPREVDDGVTIYPPENQNNSVGGDIRYQPVGTAGVWYTVQGTGSGLRASTCSSYTDYYYSIVVFSGECGNLSCVNSTTSYSICDDTYNARAAAWISEANTVYYIYLTGYDAGRFGISVSEFTPPTNQVCENAVGPVTPNGDPIPGSTVGALWDGVDTCSAYFTSPAVWYTVIGTGKDMRASTCGPKTSFDTYLSVYSGECGNLVCVGGNDDACSSVSSAVIWPSVDGMMYYVRVSGFGEASGDFELEIEELVPPVNDLCSDAVPLLPDVPVDGSIVIATSDSVPYCNYPSGTSGIWYDVTGNGNAFTLSTCSPKTELYALISVYIGSCGDLLCLDDLFANSSSVCEHSYYASSSVSWLSTEGEVYKVLVSNDYGQTGDFELTLTEFQAATNDVCEAATVVPPSDLTILGTTISATTDDDACQGPTTSGGVWYQINGVEGQFIRASSCLTETSFPTVMSLFSGTCGLLECIESHYSYEYYSSKCGGNGVTLDWKFVNSTYYILLYGADGGQPGNFGLTIRELVRPSNDDCIDAIHVEVDGQSVVGSVSDATREMDVYYCGVSVDAPGIWYKIEGTGSGIAVSTCSSATNFETAISVFSGSCGSLECIGGSSYYQCNESQYATSRMAWASSIDETYYVLVHSVGSYGGSSDFGTFELTVTSFDPPVNDVCSGAFDVVPGGNAVVGSTLNASLEFNVTCGFYGDAPGLWYKVVGTGTGLRASTCSFMTDFDSSLSVFSGSCDEQICILGSSWDPTCTSRGSTVSWIAEAGIPYYILALGSYSSALGDFELSVSEFTPVENDQCVGAIEVEADGSVIAGTLSGATLDGSEQDACIVQAYGPAVWYTVTGNGLAFRASTCTFYGGTSTAVSVFSGSCESPTCVAGNSWDSSCDYYGGSSVSWVSEVGTTYNILVHGTDSGQVGPFDLIVTSFEPPSNDGCKDAISIVADGDEIVGSQADATSDVIEAPTCGTYGQTAGVWYAVRGTGSGLRASTCSSSTTYDTAISVYAGECGSLQCVTGNDDDQLYCPSSGYSYSTSTVSWFAEEGETYYIFVHAGYSSSGVFGLTVASFATTENDSCEGGAPIAVGSLISGSTVASTGNSEVGVPADCFYFFDKESSGGGVWYTVIGTGFTLIASTCSSTENFEPSLNVYSGSCSNVTCPIESTTYEYNSGCGGYNGGYIVRWESEVDFEYHILVFGAYSAVQGNFRLSLTGDQ